MSTIGWSIISKEKSLKRYEHWPMPLTNLNIMWRLSVLPSSSQIRNKSTSLLKKFCCKNDQGPKWKYWFDLNWSPNHKPYKLQNKTIKKKINDKKRIELQENILLLGIACNPWSKISKNVICVRWYVPGIHRYKKYHNYYLYLVWLIS